MGTAKVGVPDVLKGPYHVLHPHQIHQLSQFRSCFQFRFSLVPIQLHTGGGVVVVIVAFGRGADRFDRVGGGGGGFYRFLKVLLKLVSKVGFVGFGCTGTKDDFVDIGDGVFEGFNVVKVSLAVGHAGTQQVEGFGKEIPYQHPYPYPSLQQQLPHQQPSHFTSGTHHQHFGNVVGLTIQSGVAFGQTQTTTVVLVGPRQTIVQIVIHILLFLRQTTTQRCTQRFQRLTQLLTGPKRIQRVQQTIVVVITTCRIDIAVIVVVVVVGRFVVVVVVVALVCLSLLS